MRILRLILPILLLFAFVSGQNSAKKYWVANEPNSDVTATEAQALDELSDAIDTITTSEADALNTLADELDGITAAQAATLLNVSESELADAEVELLNGASIANSTGSKAAILNAGGDLVTASNVGVADSSSVVAVEYGDGFHHITVLTLTAHIVGTPGAGANLAFGSTLYTFPAGTHVHYTTYSNIGLTAGTQQDDTPDVGVGSVVASGANATLNGTTNEDYITGQTWASTLDGTAEIDGPLGASAGVLTGISLNAAADSKKLILNAADGWHASITGNLTAAGTVIIVWDFLE
jgi:hypothetical protein